MNDEIIKAALPELKARASLELEDLARSVGTMPAADFSRDMGNLKAVFEWLNTQTDKVGERRSANRNQDAFGEPQEPSCRLCRHCWASGGGGILCRWEYSFLPEPLRRPDGSQPPWTSDDVAKTCPQYTPVSV